MQSGITQSPAVPNANAQTSTIQPECFATAMDSMSFIKVSKNATIDARLDGW